MKKRTIITLTAAAMIFAVLAFQLQKEAAAETQESTIHLTINSTDNQPHGIYTASLINDLTGQVVLNLPGTDKIATYPSIHGGRGTVQNSGDYFRIHVCSNQNWGETSPRFRITDGANIDMSIVAHSICPSTGN